MTARQELPLRYCPRHDSIAREGSEHCTGAMWVHLVPPCPLTPPLFYEIPEGDTPNE